MFESAYTLPLPPVDQYCEGVISYLLLREKDEEDSDIQDLVMSFLWTWREGPC